MPSTNWIAWRQRGRRTRSVIPRRSAARSRAPSSRRRPRRVAALEVIIYAGAIMVLFLFIVMMLEIRPAEQPLGSYLRQWLPAVVLGALSLAVLVLIIFESGADLSLPLAAASPREFGRFLFQKYWFAVEIVSFLLLVALVGALYLGRREE